jgi:hypothetical protein
MSFNYLEEEYYSEYSDDNNSPDEYEEQHSNSLSEEEFSDTEQPYKLSDKEIEREKIQEDLEKPLSLEEQTIYSELLKPKQKVSIDWEKAEEEYLAHLSDLEDIRYSNMIREIADWVDKGNKVHGKTVEEHYDSMNKQKSEQYKIFLEKERQKKEKEEIERSKSGQKNIEKLHTFVKYKKINLNAKGKLQGNKTLTTEQESIGRRAKRKQNLEKLKKEFVPTDLELKPKITKIEDTIGALDVDTEEPYEIHISKTGEQNLINFIKKIKETKPQKIVINNVPKPQTDFQKETVKLTKPDNNHKPITRLCNTVFQGSKCNVSNCSFAHSIEQLDSKPLCKFGNSCGLTIKTTEGFYNNRNKEKICKFWHFQESKESYIKRLNIPIKKSVTDIPLTKNTDIVILRVYKKDVKSATQMAIARGVKFKIVLLD